MLVFMCSCDAQSLRQEEFTNLSLDLVPEATVEQMLQLYLTVGLLSRPPAHGHITFFIITTQHVVSLGFSPTGNPAGVQV